MTHTQPTAETTRSQSTRAELVQLLVGLVVVTLLFYATLTAMGIGWAGCFALASAELGVALGFHWESRAQILRLITLLFSVGAVALGIFDLIA